MYFLENVIRRITYDKTHLKVLLADIHVAITALSIMTFST